MKNDKKIAFELLSVNKISLAIIMWVCEHIICPILDTASHVYEHRKDYMLAIPN